MDRKVKSVPFTSFEAQTGVYLYYWHRPEFKKDTGGLNWEMDLGTYSSVTHVRGSERYSFNFPELGIENPVLARSIVALLEMNIVSLVDLRDRLNTYRGNAEGKKINPKRAFSQFLDISSGRRYDPHRRMILRNSSSQLTGETIDIVLFQGGKATLVPTLFDQAVNAQPPETGIDVVEKTLIFTMAQGQL